MTGLKQKTISGVIWGSIENFSALFIQLIATVIIARILTPSDFGLIGMLTIFIALGQIITDSGFGQALIRKKNTSQIDYSSVFFLNILIGFLIYLILFVCARYIASFYKIKDLELIAKVSFLVIPINSFGLIHYTILTKHLNFKSLSKISILAALFSGLLGVIFSIYYQNVWALVIQSTSYYLLRTILLWTINSWRPNFKISITSIKEFLPFSSYLLLTGVIGVFFNNIYNLLIGKLFSASDLGYYTQADKIQKIPSTSITGVIQRVSYPILSSMQNDPERLKVNYLKIFSMACFIIFPIMAFLVVVAKDLFLLVLTKKWIEAVIYFQLLCITGALYPAQSITLNLLNIRGNSKMILKLEIARKVILMMILGISFSYSMKTVVYGQVIFSIIALFIAFYYSGREIKLTVKEQLATMIPLLVISLVLVFAILGIGFLFGSQIVILKLTAQLLGCIIIYLFLAHILKIKPYIELVTITKKLIGNRII